MLLLPVVLSLESIYISNNLRIMQGRNSVLNIINLTCILLMLKKYRLNVRCSGVEERVGLGV